MNINKLAVNNIYPETYAKLERGGCFYMKYTWEYKLKRVENYKARIKNIKPTCTKCSDYTFSFQIND